MSSVLQVFLHISVDWAFCEMHPAWTRRISATTGEGRAPYRLNLIEFTTCTNRTLSAATSPAFGAGSPPLSCALLRELCHFAH